MPGYKSLNVMPANTHSSVNLPGREPIGGGCLIGILACVSLSSTICARVIAMAGSKCEQGGMVQCKWAAGGRDGRSIGNRICDQESAMFF